MNTKTVLMCIVEWIDGEDVRVEVSGWSDCPEQRERMRESCMRNLGIDPKFVLAVRYVETEIPILSTAGTEKTVLTVKEVA